jgi:hypothetical protein
MGLQQIAGYVVKPDGGQPAMQLPFLGGQAFGIPVILPLHHVTVYHYNAQYWQEWYIAELKNDLEFTNAKPNTKKTIITSKSCFIRFT